PPSTASTRPPRWSSRQPPTTAARRPARPSTSQCGRVPPSDGVNRSQALRGLGSCPCRGTVAANPRIDELRKKLDKEPGSRLFAQLAEELRKDGEYEEAIRVARDGLQKHPNYPSARMTLGRALFDTGDWDAARLEFEQVLKGAPDNILASRLLGESLASLTDVSGAVARYKQTLALAPGDKQVLARL